MSIDEKKEALWELCRGFIDDQRIGCAETVYQSDRVIENAYEFITDICDIVGYDQRADLLEDDE